MKNKTKGLNAPSIIKSSRPSFANSLERQKKQKKKKKVENLKKKN